MYISLSKQGNVVNMLTGSNAKHNAKHNAKQSSKEYTMLIDRGEEAVDMIYGVYLTGQTGWRSW